MRNLTLYFTVITLLVIPAVQTNAHIESVTGDDSSYGTAPLIIAAPTSVVPSTAAGGASNTGQQGFDEQQDIQTTSDYDAYNPNGTVISITSGTWVDSHMLFMNLDDDDPNLLTHYNVTWTFSGTIIGVMSKNDGSQEFASSDELGDPNTIYPDGSGGTGNNRGLEVSIPPQPAPYTKMADNWEIINGNQLIWHTNVTQPGDWIRVITEGTPPEPCEPCTPAHTHGYWKNHPDDWPVETIDLGCESYSKADAIELISQPVKGDKSLSLFQQLVAAMLSVANGSCEPCVPGLIAEAQAWQCSHLPGSGVKGNSDAWHDIETVHDQLDAYVNNNLNCD